MEPVYATLAAHLRRQIATGALRPGEYLPSEATLQREQNVSRGTVRAAVAELIGEGLVVSLNGRGHQVRLSMPLVWRAYEPERNTASGEGPSDVWSRGVRDQGYTPSEQIRTEIGYADDRVAAWLCIAPGTPVAIRRRLRFVNDVPYQTADSYYPRSIVAGTEVEEPADVKPGVYAVFERLGRPWVDTIDRITSRAPTREESVTLSIPRGVAVAEVARRSFDATGEPVRLSLFILPGDRHQIEYTIIPKGY